MWRAVIPFLVAQAWFTLAQGPGPGHPTASNQPKHLEFEVATIKPIDPDHPRGNGVNVYPGGRVVINGVNPKSLVAIAFNLSDWQIEGGDPWVEKDNYNLEAKPPEGAQPPAFNLRHSLFGIDDLCLREMLQSLLIERFQLKFHRETRTGTIYLLERSGKPLHLRPAKVTADPQNPEYDNFGSIGWAGRWVLSDVTMAHLAKFGADFYLHRSVVDRTGLDGAYDYESPNHEDADSHFGDQLGSFTNMIQEIGLKLTPTKGSVDFLVIDHAEKPSPN